MSRAEPFRAGRELEGCVVMAAVYYIYFRIYLLIRSSVHSVFEENHYSTNDGVVLLSSCSMLVYI